MQLVTPSTQAADRELFTLGVTSATRNMSTRATLKLLNRKNNGWQHHLLNVVSRDRNMLNFVV